ncbi:hypothetical protein JOC85_000906 [Bacillus mesophilus]|uniref:Prolipoprotein diacylglyceryl transferase n=1 Tax=Bacillus mesophilus TaxID=1808955 RepID=A0A6M0QBR8_9BACI|nr:hypothetical protein [Bacillus mesophilus]MBM7660139.1 hypothetical protein [Bacillus mesophilus]NEY73792.1 hypothetical protein [Bacillus mesophilus]
MEIIQIASIAILLKWFLLGIAIILGLVVVHFYMKVTFENELRKKVFELISNSVFLGFIVWKGSLLLLEPTVVIKSPLSLLYFTGGSNGLLIAIIFSITNFLVKAKTFNHSSLQVWKSGILFIFVVLSGYHILAIFFLENNLLYHLLNAVGTIILLLFGYYRKYLFSLKGIFTIIIIFSFYRMILSFALLEHGGNQFLMFTFEQWFFVGAILISIFYWDRKK